MTSPELLEEEETIEILRSAPFRRDGDSLQILFRQEWYSLCRSDLEDKMVTSSCEEDESIEDYVAQVLFGAYVFKKEKLFAIIDSATDG